MNLFALIVERVELNRKRRLLERKKHWRWEVLDQVKSGQVALAKVEAEILNLEAEIFASEPPDEIVRRSGMQA